MRILWNDLRYSIRTLRKSPAFTCLAVLILALGIGATTAIFSVVNAVLIRPLPYQDPLRLVALSTLYQPTNGKGPESYSTVSLNEVETWRNQSQSLESLGSFVFSEMPVQVGQQSYFLVVVGADPELLSTLGVSPSMGRNFAGTGSSHKDPSVIISHRVWVSDFNSDPQIIGRSLTLDGDVFTVTGVMPATFQFPRADASFSADDPDIIEPIANLAETWGRNSTQWLAIGRLHTGVTQAHAESELQSLSSHMSAQFPAMRGMSVRLTPLDAATTKHVRPALLLMLGISVVLLLIACTNIMNLLFSRAATRSREMAIRKAVGANTWRLVRQMLTESAFLTFLGGILGVALAWSVLDILVGMSPAHLPISGHVEIDPIVLGFTFVVCAASAIVAGLVPALHTSLQREDLLGGSGTRTSGGRTLANVQRALTVTQVALGLALLTAAGLLSHSLWLLSSVNPGFRTQGVFGFEVAVPSTREGNRELHAQQIQQLYQRMLDETRSIPGVISAGWITNLPPETLSGVFVPFSFPEKAKQENAKSRTMCNFQVTSEDYFQTVGAPLQQGRDFTAADGATAAQVAIINEAFARRFFPNENPIGQQIITMADSPKEPRTIVGVLKDIHDRGLDAKPISTVYVPYQQFALAYGGIAVRSELSLAALAPEVRQRMERVDPSVAIKNFQSLDTRIHKTLDEPRFYTVMAAACAFMATLFVTLGLYGVIAYSVSRRTAEIGIRMALGARSSGILTMVLKQGLQLAAIGVVAGVGLSLAASRVLTSFLFQVKPSDPAVLIAASLLVIVVTLLASYFPARRASNVDPMVALRHQ